MKISTLTTRARPVDAGCLLIATLMALNANAAAPSPQVQATPTTTMQRVPAIPAPPPLQASVNSTKIEVVLGESLATARGGLVTIGLKYRPSPVASLQVPGALSYRIGPFPTGFDHSITNADIRALLRKDEAQILERCRGTLDFNKLDVTDTVHDTTIPLNLHAADGTVLASASVSYQLGLTCKRPLIVRIPNATIGVDINRPFAEASGTAATISLSYNGSGSVSFFQPGGVSYPVGARQGPFEQTISSDLRAVLVREEAAIIARCRQTLEYNNLSTVQTAFDTVIPVVVMAASGSVVASTSVAYQLGLNCRR
jgi:hypothetical protein